MAHETRQSNTAELRGVSRGDRTVDIIASTFDIDSHGTRIDQNGWELEAFRKNPVICLQHDDRGYTSSNGLPIANAIPETIRVESNRLLMRLRFPSEGTFPLADQVFNLVADGFMRGVSVGFNPMEYEDVEEEEEGYKKTVRIYRKQQLLEVSLVTIPSNDNALVQRATSLNADVNVIRRMTEQVETLLDEAAKPTEEQVTKWRAYFEKKQPANREATKVLEKFYKRILKEDAPADEVAAWTRMGEAVEAMEEKSEEVIQEETKEEVKQEEVVETPEVKDEVVEEPAPAIQSPVETQDARKAFVQVSLAALPSLARTIRDTCVQAALKASEQGLPQSEWNSVIDATGNRFQEAIPQLSK